MPDPAPPPADAEELPDDFDSVRFEEDFYRDHPALWLLTLVGPVAVTVAVLVFVYVVSGAATFWKLIGTALASFFGLGKFVILGGQDHEEAFFSAAQLFGLVFYMDVATAVILVYHSGFLFKLPLLGAQLRELVKDGQFILASHPWMKRATFAAIVAFVMVPVAATGAIGGALFGRLLGMTRLATLAGIALGSFLGCGVMYFGAELVNRWIDKDSPWLVVGGIAVILALVYLLNRRYKAMRDAHFADRADAARLRAEQLEKVKERRRQKRRRRRADANDSPSQA